MSAFEEGDGLDESTVLQLTALTPPEYRTSHIHVEATAERRVRVDCFTQTE
jgi:hypothetical protein